MNKLLNKQIIVGVTGGIAAYKSADLVRRLQDLGATVQVVMTDAAKEFITPLTMQAVSGRPVRDSLLDVNAESGMGHIELARWADAIVIAPASADFIARLSHGHANDLLTTLCLASQATIAIAPAMNQQMWHDTKTQSNINLLKQQGINIIGPGIGQQACGDYGYGRMIEPSDIANELAQLFQHQSLSGKRILITAGPTHEHIDPVRFISNHSSGKMGYAIAQAAQEAAAQVCLVSGPVAIAKPERVELISVISAMEMYQVVMNNIANIDIFIAVAAVADYRIDEYSNYKIKSNQESLNLQLQRNPDILKEVANLPNKPFCVGFAAQTHDLLLNAKQKLIDKKVDMIVANQVDDKGTGFNSDDNEVTIVLSEYCEPWSLMSKSQLANKLIKLITEKYYAKSSS